MENKVKQENIILSSIKINKKNGKMIPGTYMIDDIEYFVNTKGFRGKDFKKENQSKCRIISLLFLLLQIILLLIIIESFTIHVIY